MNSVHYLLFIPFHIGSAEIEKAAKVRKFKDFHESVRRSPIIVSTWLDRSGLMSVIGNLFRLIWYVPKCLRLFAETYLQILYQKYLDTFRYPYHSLNLACSRKKFNFFIRFYYYSDSNIKVKFCVKPPSPQPCLFFVQRTCQRLFFAPTDGSASMHSTLVS